MKTVTYRRDTSCRVCESSDIETVWSLNPTPLGDDFRPTKTVHDSVPMDLAFCRRCSYLHLATVVRPSDSYGKYLYHSGVTVGLREHFELYATDVCRKYSIQTSDLVLDIGSNDGSMLSAFRALGLRVIGVEPAPGPARFAQERGLTTINGYFDDSAVDTILRNYGAPKIITANYVFANIDNIARFLNSVASLLDGDGVLVIETGYHPEQFKKFMFDYIYHEHFSYFSLKVLNQLLERCGFKLLSVSQSPMKGGSIRVEAQLRTGVRERDDSIDRLLFAEEVLGIASAETYYHFRDQVIEKGKRVNEILQAERKLGRTVVGFGASHSTTTLIYQFGLGEYLDYLVDDNQVKHGLYSPGLNLEVRPVTYLETQEEFSVILLAWQHRAGILSRHAGTLALARNVIIPLPELQVQ